MLRVWMVRERGLDGEIGQLTHSGSAKKLPQRRTMEREGWDRLPKLQQKNQPGTAGIFVPLPHRPLCGSSERVLRNYTARV